MCLAQLFALVPAAQVQFDEEPLTHYLPKELDARTITEAADVDGDGDLDVILLNPPRFWRNDGTGVFEDATAELFLGALPTKVGEIVVRDLDADGVSELLFVGTVLEPLMIFEDDGSGVFVDVTAARVPVLSRFVRGIAVGDLEGDAAYELKDGSTHPFPQVLAGAEAVRRLSELLFSISRGR